ATTVVALGSAGAFLTHNQIPLALRLPNVCAAIIRYLEKSFWPSELAPIYPWVSLGWSSASVLSGMAVLLVVTVVAILLWKSKAWLATGWFWFVGLLVPVLGLVQVGIQSWADRYSYLPQIGL